MAKTYKGFQLIGIESGREQVPDTIRFLNTENIVLKPNQPFGEDYVGYFAYVSACYCGEDDPEIVAYQLEDGMKFRVALTAGETTPAIGMAVTPDSDDGFMSAALDEDGIFIIENLLDWAEDGDEVIVRFVQPQEIDDGGDEGDGEA